MIPILGVFTDQSMFIGWLSVKIPGLAEIFQFSWLLIEPIRQVIIIRVSRLWRRALGIARPARKLRFILSEGGFI
jgi:hypothetical protein